MLTIADITQRLNCSRSAVESWISSGELLAVNVAPSGGRRKLYRVSTEALAEFQRKRGSGQIRPVPAMPTVKEYV